MDGYRRLLRGDYEIDTAAAGGLESACKTVLRGRDCRHAHAENGRCAPVSKNASQYPATMRIMLAGNSDMQTAEEKVRKILAVKSGSIRTPSVAEAIYVGKMIWDGPNYIVQKRCQHCRRRPSEKPFRPDP